MPNRSHLNEKWELQNDFATIYNSLRFYFIAFLPCFLVLDVAVFEEV